MASIFVGREDELRRGLRRIAEGGGVLLRGPAGIGKSTLLAAIAQHAAAAGDLVLRTQPTAAEAGLPYLALLDLLGPLSTEPAELLPDHLRQALDSALLRVTPATATDELAIRVAVVELLRGLAARRPVLLVIDDAQLVDPASAAVLAFAARRLENSRVRVIATQLSVNEPESGDDRAGLIPAPVDEIVLSGLSASAVAQVVRARVPEPPVNAVLDRICAASGGNPLFALELARASRPTGGVDDLDPLPVPHRLRGLLAERLGELPAATRPVLLQVAAAARPGRELFRERDPGLSAALASGILVGEPDGGLRFRHPLLAELVYGDAPPRARQAAHARLAGLVADPVERARHQALATTKRDPALADEIAHAAELAAGRGAPGTAATLSRLAAARTTDEALAVQRLLEAATYAVSAGLGAAARADCAAILRTADPAARVRARLLLADLEGAGPQAVYELLDAASVDAAGDLVLTARVARVRVETIARVGGFHAAVAEMDEALRLARACGDVDVLIETLGVLVPNEMQSDTGGTLSALAEAARLAEGRPLSDAIVWVRQAQTVVLLRRGDTAGAIATIQQLRADVERAGRTRDLGRVLYIAASTYERAGRCRDAADAGALAAMLWADIDLPPAAGLTLRGAAALNTGTLDVAIEALETAAATAESTQDPEWEAYAHILFGRVELIRRRPAEAARRLALGRDLLRDLGYLDPAMILFHADLAEALVLSGEYASAAAVLSDGRREAERHGRHIVTLGLERVQTLLDGTTGDPRAAAERLRTLMAPGHAYPLEIARCGLTLAALERRARRRAAARAALADAVRIFEDAGCAPWLVHTQEALDQLDPADGPIGDLDRRLLELLRDGASNRTIATSLHLSVKAVEANLTRLYRRFGVSGRAELAQREP
ncbi:AAA family ATPase [Hamadaea tsunoensis]|uniref:AAA family ATPase n=1 Tax=Hamadaea tsunoensis TaxID=53368 RepID=UPI0004159DBD|nr:AAA family ATPase [Hamadaea tsunoensis]